MSEDSSTVAERLRL